MPRYVSIRRLLCNYIVKHGAVLPRHARARGALRTPSRRILLVDSRPERLRACHLVLLEGRARQLPRSASPTSTNKRCWLDRWKQASRVEERGLFKGEGHQTVVQTFSDRHEPVAIAFLHLALVGKALVRRYACGAVEAMRSGRGIDASTQGRARGVYEGFGGL